MLIADDHALVREGIRSSLERHPSIQLVGEAINGREAVKLCKRLKPQVALIDLNMPEISGLEVISMIRRAVPGTRVIALTIHDTRDYVSEALRAGAHGYALKDIAPDDLTRAVRAVASGQAYFSPPISRILLENHVNFGANGNGHGQASNREIQVLRLIAEGKTSKEIAVRLKLSPRTVETYRVRLKRKWNTRNVAELLNFARRRGII